MLIPLLGVGVTSADPCFTQQAETIRSIPVVVLNSDGKFAMGMKPQNLRLEDDKATVRSVVLDDAPRRVAILLDISANMNSEDVKSKSIRWNNARNMAKEFLDDLPTTDLVSLDVFAAREREVLSYTHDFDSIRKEIDALPDLGSKRARQDYGEDTRLGDALATMLKAQVEPPSFGDSIVVFSDGGFTDIGIPEIDDTRAHILAEGIRVFLVIATPRFRLQPPHAIGAWDFPYGQFGDADIVLHDIPVYKALDEATPFFATTGGVAFEVRPRSMRAESFDPVSLRNVMREASRAVQDTYQTRLSLVEPLTKHHKIKMKLVGINGNPLRALILLYPEYLEPAARDLR